MDDDWNLRGFYDREGRPVDPDLAPRPRLCLNCAHEGNRRLQISCALRRVEHILRGGYFECDEYREKDCF